MEKQENTGNICDSDARANTMPMMRDDLQKQPA